MLDLSTYDEDWIVQCVKNAINEHSIEDTIETLAEKKGKLESIISKKLGTNQEAIVFSNEKLAEYETHNESLKKRNSSLSLHMKTMALSQKYDESQAKKANILLSNINDTIHAASVIETNMAMISKASYALNDGNLNSFFRQIKKIEISFEKIPNKRVRKHFVDLFSSLKFQFYSQWEQKLNHWISKVKDISETKGKDKLTRVSDSFFQWYHHNKKQDWNNTTSNSNVSMALSSFTSFQSNSEININELEALMMILEDRKRGSNIVFTQLCQCMALSSNSGAEFKVILCQLLGFLMVAGELSLLPSFRELNMKELGIYSLKMACNAFHSKKFEAENFLKGKMDLMQWGFTINTKFETDFWAMIRRSIYDKLNIFSDLSISQILPEIEDLLTKDELAINENDGNHKIFGANKCSKALELVYVQISEIFLPKLMEFAIKIPESHEKLHLQLSEAFARVIKVISKNVQSYNYDIVALVKIQLNLNALETGCGFIKRELELSLTGPIKLVYPVFEHDFPNTNSILEQKISNLLEKKIENLCSMYNTIDWLPKNENSAPNDFLVDTINYLSSLDSAISKLQADLAASYIYISFRKINRYIIHHLEDSVKHFNLAAIYNLSLDLKILVRACNENFSKYERLSDCLKELTQFIDLFFRGNFSEILIEEKRLEVFYALEPYRLSKILSKFKSSKSNKGIPEVKTKFLKQINEKFKFH